MKQHEIFLFFKLIMLIFVCFCKNYRHAENYIEGQDLQTYDNL